MPIAQGLLLCPLYLQDDQSAPTYPHQVGYPLSAHECLSCPCCHIVRREITSSTSQNHLAGWYMYSENNWRPLSILHEDFLSVFSQYNNSRETDNHSKEVSGTWLGHDHHSWGMRGGSEKGTQLCWSQHSDAQQLCQWDTQFVMLSSHMSGERQQASAENSA